MIDIEIKGLDNIKRNLKKLSKDGQNKAIRKGVAKGAGIITKKIRSNVPVGVNDDPRQIKKNIRSFYGKKMSVKDKVIAYRVGILGGARSENKYVSNPWYWRLVEFGTVKMRANPFMRKSARESVPIVMSLIPKLIEKGIDDIVKRMPKQ